MHTVKAALKPTWCPGACRHEDSLTDYGHEVWVRRSNGSNRVDCLQLEYGCLHIRKGRQPL